MLDEVLTLLTPALDTDDAVMVDATLGLAGHAEAVLRAAPRSVLVGLDRDTEALAAARARLAVFGDRVSFHHARYDQLPDVLAGLGVRRVRGVLFDLGVSSLQLDSVERGFSYSRDAPLDMRMDTTTGPTAGEVVNTYPVGDLSRVLRDYGEERFARRIATAIVAQRAREPISSSSRLADLVRDAIPAAARRTGGHPAKRTFQALRIEVNGELDALRAAIPAALDALAVGGRIVVLAYQSLEDRLVKRAITPLVHPDVPPGLPIVPPELAPSMRWLTRGAQVPTEDETERNRRAAPARMRAAERIREVAA